MATWTDSSPGWKVRIVTAGPPRPGAARPGEAARAAGDEVSFIMLWGAFRVRGKSARRRGPRGLSSGRWVGRVARPGRARKRHDSETRAPRQAPAAPPLAA